MVSRTTDSLRTRAQDIVNAARYGHVVPVTSLIGAGSAPGTSVDSFGIQVIGDVRQQLRSLSVPVIARTNDGNTFLDLRSVHPNDDSLIISALEHISQQ